MSAKVCAVVPSSEKLNAPGADLRSGSVASSLAEGVQVSHLLEEDAERIAWAVMSSPFHSG